MPFLKKLKKKTEEVAKKGLEVGEKAAKKGVEVGKKAGKKGVELGKKGVKKNQRGRRITNFARLGYTFPSFYMKNAREIKCL